MFFLFSGEGPTDLGVCAGGGEHCDGEEYLHGPMTVIADQVVQERHHDSLLEALQYGYVPEGTLTERATEMKAAKKSLGLPGKKRGKETQYNVATLVVYDRKEDHAHWLYIGTRRSTRNESKTHHRRRIPIADGRPLAYRAGRSVMAMLKWTREMLARQIVAESGAMSDERLKWEVALRLYGADPVTRKMIEEQLAHVPH